MTTGDDTVHRSKVRPDCGYAFRGSGWEGIDAHWRAKHEDIMTYEYAWPLLRDGTYHGRGAQAGANEGSRDT